MYKYYKITNDLLNRYEGDRCNDEPKFIHDLGKAKRIIRVISEDIYTYIKTEDENIDKEFEGKNNVKEISYMELKTVYMKAQPDIRQYRNTKTNIILSLEEVDKQPAIVANPDYFEEIVPTMKDIDYEIENAKSHKFGVNWTGTISGTMADGDHVTGNCTVANGTTLVISAGATIYFDGGYYIDIRGKATWVGTSTSRWTIKSNLSAPLRTSILYINLDGVDNASVISYGNISHLQYGVVILDASDTNLSISYLHFSYSEQAFRLTNTANTLSISNTLIEQCSYAIYHRLNIAYTINFIDVEIRRCDYLLGTDNSGATKAGVIALNKVWANGRFYANSNLVSAVDIDNSIIDNIQQIVISYNTASTVNNSIVLNCKLLIFQSGGNATIDSVDFINQWSIGGVTSAISGGGSLNNCYVANYMGYQYVDTYVSGSSTVKGMFSSVTAITNHRIANRIETFIPASIAESDLGDNTVTIGWTGGTGLIKSQHRIRYGTVSGTYTMVATKNWDWSNWSGLSDIMTVSPSFVLTNLKSGTKYYYLAETYDPVFDVWNASAEGDFTTTYTPKVLQNDVKTDKVKYRSNETITVTGTIKLDYSTVNTNVLLEVRRASDDVLISTLMNENYSFTAGVAVTLATIRGYAIVTTKAIVEDYYVKTTLSGGTPAIDATLTDAVATYGFGVTNVYVDLLNITADKASYIKSETATIDGIIKLDTAVTAVTVTIEIRKKSDDSLITTLANGSVTFVAGVSQTLSSIFGALTYNTSSLTIETDYYLRLIISGGTPALSGTLNDLTATCDFNITTPRVLQLDIETDDIAYGALDLITITGAIKINSAITNANVLITIHKLSDDSLVATIMNKNTNFVAGVAKTFATINGSALSWSTATLSSYYVKVVVSGGTPTIEGSLNDLINIYAFIVQDITLIQLPISVQIEQNSIGVEVSL